MPNKNIFILLPDGVGLRNFAFSNFHKIGIEQKFNITYWNNTPFDLRSLGFNEIKIKNAKSDPLTDSYKNARKNIELNLNKKADNDAVYDTYRFPFSYKTKKTAVKSSFAKLLIALYNSESGLKKIREKIKRRETKTEFYKECLKTLKKVKPDFVFCTNQRPVLAIAPILAAKELKIPTGTFIFSWDNLPKATMVVETDYYFVWSEHMKSELRKYYSYIKENQIFIVGTPQFESHFSTENLAPRELFFKQHQLDLNKKYICYSGDDIVTCPDDSEYLKDVAKAVKKLNEVGNNLGIIFRRCPVDFSTRYDKVLEDYKDIIVPIAPLWEKISEDWNTILPTEADIVLHTNTIKHSEMVINLGSSMVFDFICLKKPCAFINYDVSDKKEKTWSVGKIYNYIHFRSMPCKESVIWLDKPEDIDQKIRLSLSNSDNIMLNTQEWFKKINQHPPQLASNRIWESIKQIVK